VTVISED